MGNPVVVECDACHTKNRTDAARIGQAKCGKCGNLLMDAYVEQYGGDDEENDFDFDEEDDDE